MRTDENWRHPETAKQYLDEIVGAIPLQEAQLDVMLRLLNRDRTHLRRFMDLGCGDGVLADVILQSYPEAKAVLVDFSDTMLQAAKARLKDHAQQLQLLLADYGDPGWMFSGPEGGRKTFDAVVSRFSIHHQPDERKRDIYAEIYDRLEPGGIFINIEHVAPATSWAKDLFLEYMVDHLYAYQAQEGLGKDRQQVADDFKNRAGKDSNILAPVEEQCGWLRDVGFVDVDCYFRIFEIAIFAGKRSQAPRD